MKILAIGDIQICPKSYDVVERILKIVLDRALEKKVDTVVLPGDIFEYNNYSNNYVPPSTVIQPIARFLYELCDRGFDVVMIAGNHDKTYGEFPNATDVFTHNRLFNVSTEIKAVSYGQARLITVPWLLNHEYKNRAEVVKEVARLSKEAKQNGLLPILVGHLRVVGATEKQYTVKNSNYSFIFTKDELNQMGIEYGILGDIHKHQNVTKHIDYIGSLRQRHFGEAENPTMIRYLTINDDLSVVDEYEELVDVPQYIVIRPKDEIELMNILQGTFDLNNQYRLEINFDTQIKSSLPNVHLRCTKTNVTKRKTTKPIVGTKLTQTEMIKLYNESTNELSKIELQDAIKFFQENRP